MVRGAGMVLVLFLVLGLAFGGCAQKKAASSTEAIETSRGITDLEEKSDYLISQAQAFYRVKDYRQSVELTQYLLKYVDQNSQIAKDLLEKAKNALIEQAEKASGTAVESMKQKIEGM